MEDHEDFIKALKKRTGQKEEPWQVMKGKRFKKSRNFRRNVKAMDELQKQPKEAQLKEEKTRTLLEEMQVKVRMTRWNRPKPKLNLFITCEPEGFNTVKGEDAWELITMYVDSGGTETVIAEQMLMMMEI